VPVGDVDAIADALLGLIEDDELRRRTGQAALAASARFDPVRIAGRHEALFTELVARGEGRSRSALRDAAHHVRGALYDGAYALRYLGADVIRKGKKSS
jgi:hypothetical protein